MIAQQLEEEQVLALHPAVQTKLIKFIHKHELKFIPELRLLLTAKFGFDLHHAEIHSLWLRRNNV